MATLPTCWLCETEILPSEMSWDHRVPRAHGGGHDPDNLSPAHRECNRARGAMPLDLTLIALGSILRDPRELDIRWRDRVVAVLWRAHKEWLKPRPFGRHFPPTEPRLT